MQARHSIRDPRGVAVVVLAVALGACSGPASPAQGSAGASGGIPGPSAPVVTAPADAAASASSLPTPALSGLTGHVVFSRAGGRFGEGTIFVASIDGTGERQLTRDGNSGGVWGARDGSRITYFALTSEQRGTAVVADGDGANPRVLPLPSGTLNLGTGPFSPDARRLLAEGFDDAHPEVAGIYVRDVDGGHLKRLTTRHFIGGDWSPDGKHLLLFDNEAPASQPPAPGQLYVTDADGTHVRQLTPDGVLVQCCGNYRWSPDGTTILFATQDGVLHTIAPDGSGLTDLFMDTEGRFVTAPTWSPDGSLVLLALDPIQNSFKHPQNGLYVIRADGTGLTRVLATPDFKRELTWLP